MPQWLAQSGVATSRTVGGEPLERASGVISRPAWTRARPGRPAPRRSAPRSARLEPVANAPHREDVARVVDVVLDLLAKPRDEVVDRARGAEVVVAPDLVQDRIALEHLPLGAHEVAQELELLLREGHGLPADRQGLRREVHLDVAERGHLRLFGLHSPEDRL